jgi:hypothetical protein
MTIRSASLEEINPRLANGEFAASIANRSPLCRAQQTASHHRVVREAGK